MIEWIKRQEKNIKAISILVAVIVPFVSLSFSGLKYLDANRRLAIQKTFENYHLIVSRISGGDKSDIFVSAANVYELRNYPEYREFSIRLLSDMGKNWSVKRNDLLSEEIDLTRKYLESLK